MKMEEAVRFIVIRSLGNFLLLFSLYGVGATFGPVLYYELQYRLIEVRGIHFVVGSQQLIRQEGIIDTKKNFPEFESEQKNNSTRSGPSFLDVLAGAKEQLLIPIDTQFSILIPKIGASAKVYPNVDPTNASEFLPVLQKGIAHARGTVFPGMNGNIYLFAHSTDNWWDAGRINAVFYLLNDLSPGDEVVIFFEGRRYSYVVVSKFVADPTEVSLLSDKQTGQERLVLQTCWPPGTTWERLFVVASPKFK